MGDCDGEERERERKRRKGGLRVLVKR